uniref:uncharacterized protein LOC122608333 n=1 Tax=Erigeron canadensis TaxID=72917 RepID=UPI001CB971EC|nr:uncharacterized protein LOC122608333 [Erigeron canadensis]
MEGGSRLCRSSCNQLLIDLMDSGKNLSHLPPAIPDLLTLLQRTEKVLSRVEQSPSKSIQYAMNPIVNPLIDTDLVRHPDMDVNISVACCICQILRIMAPNVPYDEKQMKEFFEMVVMLFERPSSASGGCCNKMTKVLEVFGSARLPVLMLHDKQLHRLVVRLYNQFLTVADSNSSAVILEMEKIMTMIIEESEELAPELVGLIVTNVKKDNQIASPVCWQLGLKVLMNGAAQLKPDMGESMSIALYDYFKMVEHICKTASGNDIEEVDKVYCSLEETNPSTTDSSNLKKDATRKIKLECLEGIRNMVQTLRHCQHGTRDTVKLQDIHSEDDNKDEKQTQSFNIQPMPSESATEMKGKRKRNDDPCTKQAQPDEHGENLVGSKIKVLWPKVEIYDEEAVQSIDCHNKRHKVLNDNDDEETVYLNGKQLVLAENVSATSDSALLRKVSSPCDNVKHSVAPILEALFEKHGDIASKCIFKTVSVRASLLEVVCEVVRRIQTNDATTIISEMKEIESHISDAEAGKINVSWLRAHLEAICEREEARTRSSFLVEMKANIILVKRVARMDLRERCEELLTAQEQFEKAERCVKVLDLVNKKLDNDILEFQAEKLLWAREPILQPLPRNDLSPQCGLVYVQGYKVKQNVGPILEAIFMKHGDIADKCVFKTLSVRASILEVVCEVVRQILTSDVKTVISEMEKLESRVSDAESAKMNVSWLRAHLEAIHKRNEALKMSGPLMETKVTTILVERAAQMDLNEKFADLLAAQERFGNAERCVRVLNLVEKKLNNNIMEFKLEKDSWEKQSIL